MNIGLKNYMENINSPWGTMIYRIVWAQIGDLKNLNILDFGSGFGLTANHFSQYNKVVAIEPNTEMTDARISNFEYIQLIGSLDKLKSLEDNSFDYIICHNVLEYVSDIDTILKEFERVLKTGGRISIVKHNQPGRIMQKVVFENNIEEALDILDGGASQAPNFGTIHYYDIQNVIKERIDLHIEKINGVRTFWGLQQKNEIKYEDNWADRMFKVEMKVCDNDVFKAISFYHHIIMIKK
jgi:ubiquinone/menaquinone biosynthesis C-methylase UbiE